MTTPAQLRKVATQQLDVEVAGSKSQPRFEVAGVPFAWLDEHRALHLSLDKITADEMVAQNDTARHSDGGISIPIDDMSGQAIHYWVAEAWKTAAPVVLVARIEAAASAEPGAIGDIPAAIGRPATRALVRADITTLDRVAATSDAELEALHGMGPKAIAILRDTIEGQTRH